MIHLSQTFVLVLFSISIVLFGFSVIVYMVLEDIKGVAFNKGINLGIEKGLGKPRKEIDNIIDGKTVRLLIFIPEKDCGLFLIELIQNDVSGDGVVFCQCEEWSTNENFHSSPQTGKYYKVSIFEGVVSFISV